MNKKILLFSASLGMVYLAISGNAAGPGKTGNGNLTGSPGSTATCSGSTCHSAASASNTTTQIGGPIFLTVKGGAPEAAGLYNPGVTYVVRLAGENKFARPKFGFQVTAVKKSDGTKAGTLVATNTTQTQLVAIGGRDIIEHKTPINTTLGGLCDITFEWTAPPTGTGDVDFYAVINAVNGTGSTDGDQPSPSLKATFKDKTTSIGEIKNNIASKIYPNPCSNVLNIETAGTAKFMSTVYDLAGRQVIAPGHQSNIDVSALAAGVYLLRLNTEDGQQTATFVKQ